MTEQAQKPKLPVDDFVFIPLGELTSPAGGTFFQHYVKCWWTVHPEKGAAFFNPRRPNGRRRRSLPGTPQCNSDEKIARMAPETSVAWPFEVQLIESAWVPVDIHDYQ